MSSPAELSSLRSVRGRARPRVIIVVNTDWFFVSHRLPIGRALLAAGCEVVVAGNESESRAVIEREGMRFEHVPFEPGSRSPTTEARSFAALAALYAREKPDAVHHVTVKPVLYGSTIAHTLRVPAVINAVSGLGYVFIPRAVPSKRHTILRLGVETAYRSALSGPKTRTIFQNPDDRAFFVDRGLAKLERTVLIPGSGVDLARFRVMPLPEGPPTIVLPSRLLWDKGVGELVEAARVVRRKHPTARFLFAGGTASQNPAVVPESQVRAWEAEGIVEWLGHRTDMPDIFARAHLVALPSYREGLPLALAEAAACGRACVTTDVPGCRHVVKDGETGWLVPARDSATLARAIDEALSNRAELRRRSDNARRFAEETFSKESIAAKTIAVYRELLG